MKRFKRAKVITILATLAFWFLATGAVLAQPTPTPTPTPTPAPAEPPTFQAFENFIKTDAGSPGPAFNFLVATGYVMGIVGIVYAGVLYLSAFGSEDRPALGKKALNAVITGIIIIVLSRIIVVSLVPTKDPAQDTDSIINTGLN